MSVTVDTSYNRMYTSLILLYINLTVKPVIWQTTGIELIASDSPTISFTFSRKAATVELGIFHTHKLTHKTDYLPNYRF